MSGKMSNELVSTTSMSLAIIMTAANRKASSLILKVEVMLAYLDREVVPHGEAEG